MLYHCFMKAKTMKIKDIRVESVVRSQLTLINILTLLSDIF